MKLEDSGKNTSQTFVPLLGLCSFISDEFRLKYRKIDTEKYVFSGRRPRSNCQERCPSGAQVLPGDGSAHAQSHKVIFARAGGEAIPVFRWTCGAFDVPDWRSTPILPIPDPGNRPEWNFPTFAGRGSQIVTLFMTVSVFVALLLVIASVDAGAYDATANACAELKRRTGWGCDDPASRAVWRGLNWLRGVSDCDSLCKKMNHNGGSCRADRPQQDVSTWCPQGQTCVCH